MAKIRRSSSSNGKKKNGGIVNLVEKISLLIGRNSNRSASGSNSCNYTEESSHVPEDVKEGHFAVMAMDTNEPKRFVVPLSYLSHPMFQRMLERAAEEYGYDRQGALTIPCRPYELETILADPNYSRATIDSTNSWNSSCNSMVEIY